MGSAEKKKKKRKRGSKEVPGLGQKKPDLRLSALKEILGSQDREMLHRFHLMKAFMKKGLEGQGACDPIRNKRHHRSPPRKNFLSSYQGKMLPPHNFFRLICGKDPLQHHQ